MPVTTADKRAAFRKLHESGCFIIPNPFDVGSAKALQHLGFKALASTSAGFAWTLAKADNKVTVDDVCSHLAAISAAVDIPVNADFEDGFAHEQPVALLVGAAGPSPAEAGALGVRRISVGGTLAGVAWAGFMKASKEMAEQGTFGELANGYSGGELNKMFS